MYRFLSESLPFKQPLTSLHVGLLFSLTFLTKRATSIEVSVQYYFAESKSTRVESTENGTRRQKRSSVTGILALNKLYFLSLGNLVRK